MNVLGRNFLNSCKVRRKDRVFLWDVDELTFLKVTSNIFVFKHCF